MSRIAGLQLRAFRGFFPPNFSDIAPELAFSFGIPHGIQAFWGVARLALYLLAQEASLLKEPL